MSRGKFCLPRMLLSQHNHNLDLPLRQFQEQRGRVRREGVMISLIFSPWGFSKAFCCDLTETLWIDVCLDRHSEGKRTVWIQVACESTHATSFAVRYVTAACLFCSVRTEFFQFEAKMPASCWVWLLLGLSVCGTFAHLHSLDRLDWIAPHNNMTAYFPPPRQVKKKKSARTVLRSILRKRFLQDLVFECLCPFPFSRSL